MHPFSYRAIMASIILCQPLILLGPLTPMALAQSAPNKPAAVAGAADTGQDGVAQIPLTEKQIEAFIAGQKTIGAIVDKIPDDQSETPNPRLQTALEQAVRSFGFKDYSEYEDIADNIDLVMDGFDEDSKTYTGKDVVLKKQLSELAADRSLSARERSEQTRELKDMLKTIEPVKFPNNIVVVTKYYDRLNALLEDEK